MGTLLTFPSDDHDEEYAALYTLYLSDLEATVWDNGHLTIEHQYYHLIDDETLPHTTLSPAQTRKLRQFLNKPGVRQALGLDTFQKPATREPAVSHLGREIHVETHEDRSVLIGTSRRAFELSAAEAYRLYAVLRELFQPSSQEEEQSNA